MSNKAKNLWPLLAILGSTFSQGGLAADEKAGQTHYPAGSQQSFVGPAEYFAGEVKVDMLFPGNDSAHYSGAHVTFAPGARTAWHRHPGGQHMIVTNGTALTGTRDGTVIAFIEGETVWCPSDIDHWHGSTPHAAMTHLVITGSKDGENVIWKEKVNDKEYNAAVKQTAKAMPALTALTQEQQHIIPIAAFTANGDLASLKTALKEGLDAGLTVNEIKEVLIHLYAYTGFPRSLNGLATFMAVVDERRAQGIKDEVGEAPNTLPSDKNSLELGKAVQTELAGRPVTGPLFDFAPGINTFLQRHLFGDLFARGILDYQSREIATLSALANIAGVESQLKAHVGIAKNVGLTKAQLTAVAEVLNERVSTQAGSKARQALQAVLPQNGEG